MFVNSRIPQQPFSRLVFPFRTAGHSTYLKYLPPIFLEFAGWGLFACDLRQIYQFMKIFMKTTSQSAVKQNGICTRETLRSRHSGFCTE